MRLFSIILTATVLLLAFKPGADMLLTKSLAATHCCVEDACTPTPLTDGADEEAPNDDCHGGKYCNPFLSCCIGFVPCLENPITALPHLDIAEKQPFSYASAFFFQFTSDFWHPPKYA